MTASSSLPLFLPKNARFILINAFILALSLTIAPLHASEAIKIDTVSGSVLVEQSENDWSPILPSKIKLPITLKTGPGGKAEISQGHTLISMNPGTVITLNSSNTRGTGLISRVKQKIGNAIYKIEKHNGDFKVETPYLVSVVKGTRFSVFTDSTNSFVTVTEGLVEVSDLRTGETTDLSPGDIARSISASAESQVHSMIIQKAEQNSTFASSRETSTSPKARAIKDLHNSVKKSKSKSQKVAASNEDNSDPAKNRPQIAGLKHTVRELREERKLSIKSSNDASLSEAVEGASMIELDANQEASFSRNKITALEANPIEIKDYLEEAIDRGIDISEDERTQELVSSACENASAEAIAGASANSVLSYCGS